METIIMAYIGIYRYLMLAGSIGNRDCELSHLMENRARGSINCNCIT